MDWRDRGDREGKGDRVKEGSACMMHVGSTLRQIAPLRQKDLWIKEGVIEPCVCEVEIQNWRQQHI